MEFLLKQRLVGAVVLVALGVIFIPMFLEGPKTVVPEMEPFPEASRIGSIRPLQSFPPADAIPEEPQQAVVVSEIAVPAEKSKPAEKVKPAEKSKPVEKVKPVVRKSPPAVIPPTPAKPVSTSKAGQLDGWVVQVGSFSSDKNAAGLRSQLRKAGFATQIEKARIGGKVHYRVRVGPYLEKQEAEKIRLELEKKMQLKGQVLSN